MPDNIGQLVDSNKFSEFYYNKLKEKLNLTDVNLNRLGFIGFFIELLGNVQYDVKGYYDYLFNESFPISSSDNINLLYHSAVYGYSPDLAKPAEIIGSFNINPIIDARSTVYRRELLLDDISFIIDNVEFRLDAIYKIIYTRSENSRYYSVDVEILYKDSYDIIPVLYSNSKVKSVGLLQYSKDVITISTSNYSFGNHYIYDLHIDDYLYELKIEVKLDKDSDVYTEFNVLPIKEFAQETDKVVFYSILPNNLLRLEFGSGLKGMYVPSRSVRITIKTTKAEKGNIGQHNISLIKGVINQYDYDESNNLIYSDNSADDGHVTYAASSLLTLDIINGIGGKNPASQDTLRKELLKYIQTRENLVSDTDFHNNLKTYSDDSEILFKKSEIAENVIYLYGRLLNKYYYPVYATTETILKSYFELELRTKPNKLYIVNPTFVIDGGTFNCPFYFEYNSIFKTYDGYIYYENIDFFPSTFPVSNLNEIPKDLFITLEYTISDTDETKDDKTTIYIKTKTENFDNVTSIILSSDLFGQPIVLTKDFNYDSQNSYFYYIHDGVIYNPSIIDVLVTIYDTNNDYNNSYNFQFKDVQNVFSQIQNLRLRFYTKDTIKYVMNVPLIYSSEYNKDRLYYTNVIKLMFDTIKLKENRMISDDVQFRFLNTYSAKQLFNTNLLKQKYDMTFQLPFKLTIGLTFSRDDVILQKLNVTEIVENIRVAVSKYIIDTTTGLDLSFYKSKISDICHNYPAVKLVVPVLTDATELEIPNGAIESVHKDIFISNIDKLTYLNYTPIYWWFDINNISITSTMI